MFGKLFGIRNQFLLQMPVFFIGVSPTAGARNGPYRNLSVFESGQNFRRGADDVEILQVELVHVGRRINCAQCAVHGQWLSSKRYGQAL